MTSSKSPVIAISGVDHLVIYASDVARTVDFYTTVLGMSHVIFEGSYHALRFGDQKINIHDAAHPFEPHAARTNAGGLDVCLLTQMPILKVVERLHECEVAVVEGPCQQTGARGTITSVYIKDPDGNLIEIATYST
ncbi:VOC family protein [Salinibacterium sp. G-O1]|uniref:VOC family protein n=1 Tax=Salinibacterium sp. G-O1 TaxID=3046208 RepID=UPI0024BB20CA|nr:VOC family protein [Salinibacterium sp. G-O1]MDJ0336569.1 VOC family protein [Salinibacterium sp. G-O1]